MNKEQALIEITNWLENLPYEDIDDKKVEPKESWERYLYLDIPTKIEPFARFYLYGDKEPTEKCDLYCLFSYLEDKDGDVSNGTHIIFAQIADGWDGNPFDISKEVQDKFVKWFEEH